MVSTITTDHHVSYNTHYHIIFLSSAVPCSSLLVLLLAAHGEYYTLHCSLLAQDVVDGADQANCIRLFSSRSEAEEANERPAEEARSRYNIGGRRLALVQYSHRFR